MRRRWLLSALGGTCLTVSAGCLFGEDSPGPTETADDAEDTDGTQTPAQSLGGTPSSASSSCPEVVHTIVLPDDTDSSIDATALPGNVEATVAGGDGTRHFVLRDTGIDTVQAHFRGSDASVLSVATVRWCFPPLCESRTFVHTRTGSSDSQLGEWFPDSVAVLAGRGATSDVRIVYSRTEDFETLRNRAENADLETGTAIGGTVVGCSSGTQTPSGS